MVFSKTQENPKKIQNWKRTHSMTSEQTKKMKLVWQKSRSEKKPQKFRRKKVEVKEVIDETNAPTVKEYTGVRSRRRKRPQNKGKRLM